MLVQEIDLRGEDRTIYFSLCRLAKFCVMLFKEYVILCDAGSQGTSGIKFVA